MARQEGGQCSIGPMRARTAWVAGAAGAAIAAWRKFRQPPPEPAPVEDPRAEELDSAETTVDEAEPVDVQDRRDAVHERGRAAADEMRRRSGQ